METRAAVPRGERVAQAFFLFVYFALIVLGLLSGQPGPLGAVPVGRLFWTFALPITPLFMVVFGYYVWRRLCPLGFLSRLAGRVHRSRQRRVSPFLERWGYLVLFVILYVCFGARLLLLNGSAPSLALFLIVVAIIAFGVNAWFTGKTWCNFFCPVGLVERIYLEPTGMASEVMSRNSQCQRCTACKRHCSDIDVELAYWKEAAQVSRRIASYAFPGLVFGFYFAYWTYSGTWDYYFSGAWASQPDEWKHALGPGFFFAPAVPKVLAVYLAMLAPALVSLAAFFGLERLLSRSGRRDPIRAIHICLTLSAFAAFDMFYYFAGAPTWRSVPGAQYVVWLVSSSLAAWFLLKRLPRREEDAVKERFAKRFLSHWPGTEEGARPPADLREAFYVLKSREHEREIGLRVYADTVQEMLSEGLLTRAELRLLEQVRSQFNISQADHERVMAQLGGAQGLAAPQEPVGMTVEERLQERGYRGALHGLILSNAPRGEIEELRREYGISSEVHRRILGELTDLRKAGAHRSEELLTRIEDLRAVHRMVASFLTGTSLDFLTLVLVRRQDRLVDQVLEDLSLRGHGELIKQQRQQLFHSDRALRRAAIEALQNELEPAVMRRLLPVLERRVVQQDGPAPTEAEQERVLDALSCTLDPFLRAGSLLASAAPGVAGRPSSLERVLAGVSDEDKLVRAAALQALPVCQRQAGASPSAGDGLIPTTDLLRNLRARAGATQSSSVTGRFEAPPAPDDPGSVSTPLERVLFLRYVPLFVDLDPEDLLALAEAATERTYDSGATLFRQGEVGDEVFIVLQGAVRLGLLGEGAGESERALERLGPGDYLGETSVVDGAPRAVTATADGTARVLVLAGATFRQLLEERVHLSMKVIAVLAARLREAIEHQGVQARGA